MIIGGVSAALQGVPAVTYDLDIVLDPESHNLDRAHELLAELEACYREHLPRRIEPVRSDLESAGAKLLQTKLGPLDVLGELGTGWRHADLAGRTERIELGEGFGVDVLTLAALIEVKEAVGREKDHAVLPLYRRALRERGDH